MKIVWLLLIFGFSQVNCDFLSRKDPVASGHKVFSNCGNNGSYHWQEEFLENVPIDHFSFADDRSFKLRYFINLEHYEAGGPILFYTGNEGNLESFAENTGFMFDIAPQFKAAVVFAEHRFYGGTKPFGNSSYSTVKNLGYLSSEQALGDFVLVINYLKSVRIPNGANSPVIAFGGSYGGMLAAWIRIKYPHLVQGAIASSAPVFWFRNANVRPDSFGYITTRTFKSSGCSVKKIASAFKFLDEYAKTEQGRLYLNKVFSLDPKSLINNTDDVKKLKAFLADTMKTMAMVDYPYPANFLAPLPAWPVKHVCRKNNRTNKTHKKGNVEILIDVLQTFYNYTGEKKSFCFDTDKCPDPFSQLGDPLGWPWQACTEMVMPQCDSGLPNDVFAPDCPFNVEKYINETCQKVFGSLGYNASLTRPDWIIQDYGGRFPAASNIVFSNGKLDPWSGGGWRNVTTREGSLVSIILEQGAHHYDLRGCNQDDTEEVKKVRQQEIDEIQRWIKEFRHNRL
uniref:Uncharacterized protein n=1 Tax=Panagrolaimus sp. JU765 TaxID=591449 RepID=A0AC34QB69_9BILA